MQLEVGKYYRTRDGRKVGPIKWSVYGNQFATAWGYAKDQWYTQYCPYHKASGKISIGDDPNSLDLIAEWTDEPAQPTLSGITIDHIAIDSLRHHYATEMEPLQKEAFRIVLRYYGVTV